MSWGNCWRCAIISGSAQQITRYLAFYEIQASASSALWGPSVSSLVRSQKLKGLWLSFFQLQWMAVAVSWLRYCVTFCFTAFYSPKSSFSNYVAFVKFTFEVKYSYFQDKWRRMRLMRMCEDFRWSSFPFSIPPTATCFVKLFLYCFTFILLIASVSFLPRINTGIWWEFHPASVEFIRSGRFSS